ncbi:hypothetical protein ACPV5S_15810 [Vibrio astriarenae]
MQQTFRGPFATLMPADCQRNDRFCYGQFREQIILRTRVGDYIQPRALSRLARDMGATGSIDRIRRNLTNTFNISTARLTRRKLPNVDGYVYFKE